jgi:hypothetical protein
MFYFSDIIDGYSNQLTIERAGNGADLVGAYSILESEYINTCHVGTIVGNAIDSANIDVSSDCSFIPSDYDDKCFVSVRNNVMSSSSDSTCRGEGYFMGKLTNSTNLMVQAHTRACGDREVLADIVCFLDETSVNRISTGEVHMSSGTDFSIGSTVDMDNSFLIHSCRAEEYGIEDINVQCKFKDTSTITCLTSELGTTGTAPQECEIYVIEFPDESSSSVIHHIPTDAEVSNVINFSTTFSPEVSLNLTSLFCSYSFRNGEGTASSRGEYPCSFVSNDTINCKRGRTGNTDPSHNMNCEIATWPTRKDPIKVILDYPPQDFSEYDVDPVDMKFNASITSSSNLRECHLWHNATGYWHLNQSLSIGGKNADVNFYINGMSNVSFLWNIQCENAQSDIVFGYEDRRVVLKKLSAPNLNLISPIGQNTQSPVQINVSGDENLVACNYSLNYGEDVAMTKINDTYYSSEEYYVRNGDNHVDVYCSNEDGRVGTNSSDFSFIASLSPKVTRGSTQISDGNSEVSVSMNTKYLANTFLMFSVRSATSTPSQIRIEGVLNKNNITFSRYSTSGDVDIEWKIVESPNIFVRRGVRAFSTTESFFNIGIDTFDLTESFIIHSNKVSSTTTNQNNLGYFTGRYLDSNTLRFERGGTIIPGSLSWQAIEWDGSTVKSGVTTFSGSTGSVALSESVDLNKSFLATSWPLRSSLGWGSV